MKARISFKNLIVCRYLTEAIRTLAWTSNGLSISGSGRPYLHTCANHANFNFNDISIVQSHQNDGIKN